MKIYFAGSIRGGREYRDLYHSIIIHLEKFGKVLSEHIGSTSLTSFGEEEQDNHRIHQRDMEWLTESDVVIAEVSIPSLGVGYEIGRALEKNKPILCLYKQDARKKLSAMIAGSQELTVVTYQDSETALQVIDEFMNTLMS